MGFHPNGRAAGFGPVALVAFFMAIPPIFEYPLFELWGPYPEVLAYVESRVTVTWWEAPVVASHLVRPLSDLLAWLPGLCVAWIAERKGLFLSGRALGPRQSVSRSSGAALVLTILVASILHAVADLPTGYIAPDDSIAHTTMQTKLVDVGLNSILTGIMEEYYYRQKMYVVLRDALGWKRTIVATAVAFASCHPADLMAWALIYGCFSGLVRERTGHVLPCIIVHVLWNAFAYADAWKLI